jgi:hypothetical protein
MQRAKECPALIIAMSGRFQIVGQQATGGSEIRPPRLISGEHYKPS